VTPRANPASADVDRRSSAVSCSVESDRAQGAATAAAIEKKSTISKRRAAKFNVRLAFCTWPENCGTLKGRCLPSNSSRLFDELAVTEPAALSPDLLTLVQLFYSDPTRLGTFEEVSSGQMARDYRMLLAHQDHMTVTVERYHNCPVDVEVLETQLDDRHYARKILLRRQSDKAVVQFGIVRLDFTYIEPDVRKKIESQSMPLGRILINHNVMRDVHLSQLWKVTPGADLQKLFGLPSAVPSYGRTAVIDCNGEPAIELLEIVTPLGEILEGLGIRENVSQ
jgi:chorismate-pyruvate lyase